MKGLNQMTREKKLHFQRTGFYERPLTMDSNPMFVYQFIRLPDRFCEFHMQEHRIPWKSADFHGKFDVSLLAPPPLHLTDICV